MLKSVLAPHLGKMIKFGRTRPTGARLKKLNAKTFINFEKIVVPQSTNYRAAADPVLRDIYGNDQLGDCVPAGFAHVLGVETGNAGKIYTETLAQCIKDYSKIGGYVPGDESTDQGCDEETALAYYCKPGPGFANGTQAEGWLAIDARSPKQIAAAMYLFENIIFGVELPDEWVGPFPEGDGFVWDVAGTPNPQNGHCFVGVDLAPTGLVIDTWAMEGIITWAAIAKYASRGAGGQLFVLVTKDQIDIAKGRAPNGIDWAGLVAAFDQMGGTVPVPTPPAPAPSPAPPAPTPVPAPPAPKPTPAGGPTLEQAIAAAESHITTDFVMTKGQIKRAITKGLTELWKSY